MRARIKHAHTNTNVIINNKAPILCKFFFFFFKSLLVSCPTHTNPPGSGLGTGGIHFDKHISESKQLYLLHNLAGSNTLHVFFIYTHFM